MKLNLEEIERKVSNNGYSGTPIEYKAFDWLIAEVKRLREEVETLRMQLAGCGVAALANTPESIALNRIGKDNPYWSASYGDVCDAVDREIKLREENDRLHKENVRLLADNILTRKLG